MGSLPVVRVPTHVDDTPSTAARAERSLVAIQLFTLRSGLFDRSTGQPPEYRTHGQAARATDHFASPCTAITACARLTGNADSCDRNSPSAMFVWMTPLNRISCSCDSNAR